MPSNDSNVPSQEGDLIRQEPAAPAGPVASDAPPVTRWRQLNWYKVPLFLISLVLFVLAITLMKDAARDLAPFVRDRLQITNFADALGFGWIFSYLIMSGSPVAATGLAFLDAGIVDRLGAYGMIVGSRMGASFIVLFIGFLYVLRGRNRSTSLSMGLLSLSVAGSIQLLALGIGIYLLRSRLVDHWQMDTGAVLTSVMDQFLDPVSTAVNGWFPGWIVFLIGLGIIMTSFSLFDRSLPEMSVKGEVSTISQFVYRPWVMFLLGSAITVISMSVSISLGILVPLSQRGLVRRENIIPYIMGANITTFIDTLLAAVLLQNAEAFTVVMAGMLSLFVVSALILLVSYNRYENALLDFVEWTIRDNRNLSLFMIAIFAVPLLLLLL